VARRLIGGVAVAGVVALAALLLSFDGNGREVRDFDDLSGPEIAALASEEMRNVGSVQIEGSVGVEFTHLSLRVADDGTCRGRISLGGSRADFLRIRKEPWLVRANASFLRWVWAEEASDDDIWQYAERWLRSAVAPGGDGLADPCDLAGVFEYTGAGAGVRCAKGGHSQVRGVAVVVLDCAGRKRLYVATRAPHHVLRVTTSDADPSDVTFRNFDVPFDVDLPPESEVINLTESI